MSNHSSNSPIFIVYHIGVLGSWHDIAQEQLQLLDSTGLGNAAAHIYIQAVGAVFSKQKEQLEAVVKGYPFSHNITLTMSPNLQLYEFPSIKQVLKTAEEYPDAKILYFHTKGASYTTTANIHKRHLRPAEIQSIVDFRHAMEHHNIIKWEGCLKILDEFDVCGVSWMNTNPHEPSFFGGNFWWANAGYLNRCSLGFSCCGEGHRFKYERFIGMGNPRAQELSGLDY